MAKNVRIQPKPVTLDETAVKTGAADPKVALPLGDSEHTRTGSARPGYAGKNQAPYTGTVPHVSTGEVGDVVITDGTSPSAPPRLKIEKK